MWRSIVAPGRSAWIVALADGAACADTGAAEARTAAIARPKRAESITALLRCGGSKEHGRPAVRRPAYRGNTQGGDAAVLRVIGVIDEVIAGWIAQHGGAARAFEALIADQQLLAVAMHHVVAVRAEERTRDLGGAAGDDVVGAAGAAAAEPT